MVIDLGVNLMEQGLIDLEANQVEQDFQRIGLDLNQSRRVSQLNTEDVEEIKKDMKEMKKMMDELKNSKANCVNHFVAEEFEVNVRYIDKAKGMNI